MRHILHTGMEHCYGANGDTIPCNKDTAICQDAAFGKGTPWPKPRFFLESDVIVRDALTGLFWSRDANPLVFPITWGEALAEINALNSQNWLGRNDWRLPNRRELRSLVNHGARKPALPGEHPFNNVFLGWYWSATTAAKAPAYAWYVHFEGGRMFYGAKTGYCLVWPVCGQSTLLPATGQKQCFSESGQEIPCADAPLQDGALQLGATWPEPRFRVLENEIGVLDRLTRLVWQPSAAAENKLLPWEQALETAMRASQESGIAWRLPNINELESLVDCSRHTPALPEGHPFADVQQAYWSSTTSFYETDWSFCLYMDKGAVGVGHKPKPEFYTWLVTDEESFTSGE